LNRDKIPLPAEGVFEEEPELNETFRHADTQGDTAVEKEKAGSATDGEKHPPSRVAS
jgi:hypothetical protein